MKDTNHQMGKNQDDSSEATYRKSNKSRTHKKLLTPTKDHPLKDLEISKARRPKSEFMDDSDDAEEETVDYLTQSEDSKTDDVGFEDTVINEINEIPPEPGSYQATTIKTIYLEDETNNNSPNNIEGETGESDEECLNGKSAAEKVILETKLSMTNNNTTNVESNNRMSNQLSCDLSQPRAEDMLSKSTDKLEGKSHDS